MPAFAVVAAGGSGQRLGSQMPKFESPILGRPMVMYSLEALQRTEAIDSIVLVVPAERVSAWSAESLKNTGISKAYVTLAGGATRQESVWLGLGAIGQTDGIVAVHDAARPLITPEMIASVCAIPEGFAGLIPVVPVTDTVKRIGDGYVKETVDRSDLVAVQTPQAFDLATLVEAHRAAREAGFAGTDDAALVERAGGRVGLVEGSRDNIKVTYPQDIVMAEATLSERGAK